MRTPPIAKLKTSIYIPNGLDKSEKAKIEAEYNKYFTFLKAYYCYIP